MKSDYFTGCLTIIYIISLIVWLYAFIKIAFYYVTVN